MGGILKVAVISRVAIARKRDPTESANFGLNSMDGETGLHRAAVTNHIAVQPSLATVRGFFISGPEI